MHAAPEPPTQKQSEFYYCFYPTTPLWIGSPPDFQKIRHRHELAEFMTTQVCRLHIDGDAIAICNDGLCMLHELSLLEQMDSAHGSGTESARRWLALHRSYVRQLCAFQML